MELGTVGEAWLTERCTQAFSPTAVKIIWHFFKHFCLSSFWVEWGDSNYHSFGFLGSPTAQSSIVLVWNLKSLLFVVLCICLLEGPGVFSSAFHQRLLPLFTCNTQHCPNSQGCKTVIIANRSYFFFLVWVSSALAAGPKKEVGQSDRVKEARERESRQMG